MKTTTRGKRLQHAFAISDVREDPQLQLTVVGDDQSVPRLGHERVSYFVGVFFQCCSISDSVINI